MMLPSKPSGEPAHECLGPKVRAIASLVPEKLYPIKEAAAVIGIAYWRLLAAVRAGDIPTYRLGSGRKMVRLSDIEEVLRRQRDGGAQK